uniref:Ion_trans domain-containing protein n=1 Tax=Macrostomum lignano TaxID=282301 RepID=A0A1I8JRP9_9PLAT
PRLPQMESSKSAPVPRCVKSQAAYWIIIVLVFCNTVVLATQYYNQPRWLENLQNKANYVFVAMFTFEMLLKIFLFNKFDFFVVASLSEVLLTETNLMPNLGISRAALRTPAGLRVQGHSLLELAQESGGLSIGLDEEHRLAVLLLFLFIILTGEDWNMVMYHGINSNGGIGNLVGIMVSFYFVILVHLRQLHPAQRLPCHRCGQPRRQRGWRGGRSRWKSDGEGEGGEGEAADGEDGEPTAADSDAKVLRSAIAADADKKSADEEEGDEEGDGDEDGRRRCGCHIGASPTRLGVEHENQDQSDPPASSLFVFSSTNRFRVLCHKILLVLVCILVSSAMLAAEEPVNSDNNRKILNKFDYFLTTVFTIESFSSQPQFLPLLTESLDNIQVTAYGLCSTRAPFVGRPSTCLRHPGGAHQRGVVTYGAFCTRRSFLFASTFNLLRPALL